MISVTLNSPFERAKAAKLLRACLDGWRVTFAEPKRSEVQSRRMWAMLTDISRQVEWYGEHLSPDDWKTMTTASLRKCRVIPGIDAGTLVPIGLRTSKMSVKDMNNLIEFLFMFGAEHNVVWSDPAEQRAA